MLNDPSFNLGSSFFDSASHFLDRQFAFLFSGSISGSAVCFLFGGSISGTAVYFLFGGSIVSVCVCI